jgi:starvation-inducible DNA-binding protein
MAEDWILINNQTIADELEPVSDDLITSLRTLLANNVSVYFRAHGYHWNVKGINFSQYHDFFQKIYEDLYSAIDPTGEWLRKLNVDADYQLVDFIENRDIENPAVKPVNAIQMVKDLYNAIEALNESTESCLKVATQEDEQGLINFLGERIDMLDKWEWQLKTTFAQTL